MTPILVVPSLYNGNEFYVFRPLGNDSFREVKFHIKNNLVVQNPEDKLHQIEKLYIVTNIIKNE